MHSSRMRTGRSLTVCRSLLPGVCVCSQGGVCSQVGSRGLSAPGGYLLLGGRGCLLQGLSAWGMSAPGGSVCSWGSVVSQHALRQTTPPVNRITNTSKNINFATTSLRPVNMLDTDGGQINLYSMHYDKCKSAFKFIHLENLFNLLLPATNAERSSHLNVELRTK